MAKKGTYTYEYPHPAVTADSVVFGYDGKQLKVLLIKRGQEKEASTRAFVGFWALPGGFLDVERDKTIAHYALVRLSEVEGDTDADKAEWFAMKDIPRLAFDHDQILRVACKRLRENLFFEPVGFDLLPEIFTLPQLQNLYESILECKFDRRNFANKMKHFGLLIEVPDESPRRGSRTPIRYKFDKDNYERLKAGGFRLEF